MTCPTDRDENPCPRGGACERDSRSKTSPRHEIQRQSQSQQCLGESVRYVTHQGNPENAIPDAERMNLKGHKAVEKLMMRRINNVRIDSAITVNVEPFKLDPNMRLEMPK